MNIKTISQITPLDGNIHSSSYFGISQYNPANTDTGKYCSRKVSYEQLSSQLSGEIDEIIMKNKYRAMNGDIPVDISKVRNDVNEISSYDFTFNGTKTFANIPKITANVNTDDQANIPNVKLVQEMIDSGAGFMIENQHLPVDPLNGTDHTYYDEFEDSPKQMYWHIDHGQTDSSLWKDEYGVVAGPITCKYTGNLVCYGWLADNGNVKPGCAWVGLFGHVICGENQSPSWVALQIQPWIIGKYSSTAQYVSFNIPVKAGLQLKIKTGFQVNGNNTALHDDRPTLMFSDAGNMPNTFVGYILRS